MNVEILKTNDALQKINIYLNQKNFTLPYFVIANGTAETDNLKKLLPKSLKKYYLSNFFTDDRLLDIDIFIERLYSIKTDAVIFGVGEYIYFTGQAHLLRRLQDLHFHTKIIFFCRGATNLLEQVAAADLKFRNNQICRIAGQDIFEVIQYRPNVNVPTDATDFSGFLKLIERGKSALSFRSNLQLQNVKTIHTFYDAVKNRDPRLSVAPPALNENQWQDYFFDDNCENFPPDHWRTFAAGFKYKLSNPYLKFVFEMSQNHTEFLKNLFFAVLDMDAETAAHFYPLRKAIIKNIPSPYLAAFLEQLKTRPANSRLKFLTDNTYAERQLMIQSVQGREKIPVLFKKNYAAMNDYLKDYDFGNTVISDYFRRYKIIKICNNSGDAFLETVQEISKLRLYNYFETRAQILEKLNPHSKLYWLDALGVEFVSFIKAQASRLGLSLKIDIARAGLPTLTSFNKDFYENWGGPKFPKNNKLDALIHSPETFNAIGKCAPPFYIDEEFQILQAVLSEIQVELMQRTVDSVILTSDHGSSRLAVMYRNTKKYTLHSNGEHSGRCCLMNEIDVPPIFATAANGYWVLTNYDKFAGGRTATVEIHGGATLEETLIPIIEFSLTSDVAQG